MRFPRTYALTIAALGMATAVLAPTSPASASPPAPAVSQGGCNPHVVTIGFDIGICINDRGTGDTAYPDIYINKAGPYQTCKIDIEVWDSNNHQLGDTVTDCSEGHHVGKAAGPFAQDILVHSFARLWVNGKANWTGDSPSIQLAKRLYYASVSCQLVEIATQNVVGTVIGHGSGTSKQAAILAAQQDANSKVPPGYYKRHCHEI